MKKIIMAVLIALMLIMPVFAQDLHTFTVDDKHIENSISDSRSSSFYIIHTKEFGDLKVNLDDYKKIYIGDEITLDLDNFNGHAKILKINDNAV